MKIERYQPLLQLLSPPGHTARIVGGAVRDSLLGHKIQDIDISTSLLPQQVLDTAATQQLRAIPTGIEHGTITLFYRGEAYQITSLRKDVKSDGRHAQVVFGSSWQEDAQRRDFTINAMSIDAQGRLYDYHHGQDDLRAKCLCFIGDASTRIREDYVRILRYVRFAAQLDFPLDAALFPLLTAHRDGLAQLSKERVLEEMLKWLQHPTAYATAMQIEETGIFTTLGFGLLCHNIPEDYAGIRQHTLAKLAIFFPNFRHHTWPISKVQKRFLTQSLPKPGHWNAWWRLQAKNGNDEAARLDSMLVAGAQHHISYTDILETYTQLQAWPLPVLPLRAADLQPHGFTGPDLGQALRQAETWWESQRYQPDKAALLAWVLKN